MDFLHELRALPERMDSYELTDEQQAALRPYAHQVRESETLQQLAKRYYAAYFEEGEAVASVLDEREENLLFALIYLARYEMLAEVLGERGIPLTYQRNVLWHYQSLLNRSFNCCGAYGFGGMYRARMRQYLLPVVFKLNRLNFEFDRFRAQYVVYQAREGGSVPLALPGYRYDAQGYRLDNAAREGFEPTLTEENGVARGYTFDADGALSLEPVELPLDVYHRALSIGDPVLSVHIPFGGRLTPESVEDAFDQARVFFPRYYPDKPFKAFVCHSWLLDAAFREMLRPDANILRFQRRFRCVQAEINTSALYEFIFKMEQPVPLDQLCPENAFQRQVLDFLRAGRHLRSGHGYILTAE